MTGRIARGGRADSRDEGSASVVLPLVLWAATLVAIVAVDVGAYLVAAARSQSLADAAALAAVSADVVGAAAGLPVGEAVRVAADGGGRVESCVCRRGSERATVAVSVEVPGLVLSRLGTTRVTAEASAILAPPEEGGPGPTRRRAGWPLPQPP